MFRFHVLANSDSEKEQNLKLQVRDAVLDYMK
ncbi:stage II sporulation protein R [Mediterraneibacter faecis]|nr:stage II sporulation protein R [Mediterraneibacter faecis]